MISEAINGLCPEAEFILNGEGIGGLTRLNPDLEGWPTNSEIMQEVERLQREAVRTRYIKDRKKARAQAGITTDALVDAMWKKDMENDPTQADELMVKIEAIRQQHPGPGKKVGDGVETFPELPPEGQPVIPDDPASHGSSNLRGT